MKNRRVGEGRIVEILKANYRLHRGDAARSVPERHLCGYSASPPVRPCVEAPVAWPPVEGECPDGVAVLLIRR